MPGRARRPAAPGGARRPSAPVRGTIDEPMTSPTASSPVSRGSPAGQTHPCARCGAPVALDVGLCERCNPLGLKDSASSQVHGTVFVAVGLAIVGLAIIARWAVAGVGPFAAEVVDVRSDNGVLTVAVRVTNEGSSPGTTTCRITDPALQGSGQPAFFLTPRIAPKATIDVDHRLLGFGTAVRPLAVDCSAP